MSIVLLTLTLVFAAATVGFLTWILLPGETRRPPRLG